MKAILTLILFCSISAFAGEPEVYPNLIELQLKDAIYFPDGYRFRRMPAPCQWSDLISGSDIGTARKYYIIWPSDKRPKNTELASVTVVVSRWEMEAQSASPTPEKTYLHAIEVRDIVEKEKVLTPKE